MTGTQDSANNMVGVGNRFFGTVNTFFCTGNTLVRSVLSLAVVLAGIASQAALAFTLFVAGVFATMLFFPALFAAVVGIFGTPDSWPWLTFNILKIFWNNFPLSIAGTLYKYIVFLPFECPDYLSWLPYWMKWLLFRESPRVYKPSSEQQKRSKVRNELWIYINGIATTKRIAKANRDLLYKMFSRPIYLCHNPTDSIIVDLIECIIQKIGPFKFTSFWEDKPQTLLEGKLRYFLTRANAEENITRVVLISHSQGTIISSNALKNLGEDSMVNELMKDYLEVYAFADCAQQMPKKNIKYLENISNGGDTVAWLGVLFPFPYFWQDVNCQPIQIDGVRVEEPLLWGHLFETHYLNPMQFRGAYRNSRLQYSRGGKLPPDVPPDALIPT